ncbi:MAG TPA: Rap1a/Tai family immunity protein [Candidatus Polarisedimenticolia bacterium]|jgi:hypothetical protein|nr:Rap1a/Tai family immunity protein [Candidatus Polarisedimenticolia bacterium]
MAIAFGSVHAAETELEKPKAVKDGGVYEFCTPDPSRPAVGRDLYQALCIAYLRGYVDGLDISSTKMAMLTCLPPEGVRGDVLQAIVVKWLLQNESRVKGQLTTGKIAVIAALLEEYACPDATNKSN